MWCWSVPGNMLREIKTKTPSLFQHNLLYLTETRRIFSNQSFKAGISDSIIIVILEPEKIQPVYSQTPAFVLVWKSKSSFRYLEIYRWKPACTIHVKKTQKERGYVCKILVWISGSVSFSFGVLPEALAQKLRIIVLIFILRWFLKSHKNKKRKPICKSNDLCFPKFS